MQTLTTGVITPIWRPISNGTAAMKIQDASGGTDILTVDTTNNVLDMTGTLKNVTGGLSSFTSGSIARQCLFSANSYFTGNGTWNTILSTLPGWRFDLAAHNTAAADEFALYYRVAGAAANAWTKYFTLNGRTGIISTTGDDTNTATITNHFTMRRTSSGTPAAGFGVGLAAQLESSTTVDRVAGKISWEWDVATDASRAALGKLSANYVTTERVCFQWKANSTVPLIGFLGATPVARPAAYTQTYATAARTVAAYTTDAESAAYTGIDNAQAGSVRGLGWRIKDPAAETTATANLRVRGIVGVQQTQIVQWLARRCSPATNSQLAQFRRLRRHALMVDSGHIAQIGYLASIQAIQARTRSGSDQANSQLRQFRRIRRHALMVDSGHIFIAGWLASVQARQRATNSAQTSLRLWRTMVYLPPWDPTTYTGYINVTELDRHGGFIELARGAVTELQRVDGFIEIARRELTELEK